MMSITNDIEVISGLELPPEQLAKAAQNVSVWLDASVPNTKAKSVETLIKGTSESIYATYDGHAVGHGILKLWPELAEVEVGNNRGSPVLWEMPHYGIESVIVHPGMQGLGIGKLLLGRLVAQIKEEIAVQPLPNHEAALASAVTCQASLPLFWGQGFRFDSELAFVVPPYSEMKLEPQLEKEIVSQILTITHK